MPSKTVRPRSASNKALRRPEIEPGTDKSALGETDWNTSGTEDIQQLQILNEDGNVATAQDQIIADQEMLRIHRAMVLSRKLDQRMINMQRQGEMGTFAPGIGQEATQIGQVYPLLNTDWFSPSYRSFGAQLWRGWSIEQLLLLWGGYFQGFPPPDGVNDLPFSIVIGSHVPLAVGVAMGMQYREDHSVMLTNFGDGAISQGIVNESFNFAAVYKAPVVFVCENNGWAISTPTENQAATESFVSRAAGFGIPAIRVDGNDILGMIHATTSAIERARKGKGPSLIEAVTYRMAVHTTADDPKVYRRDEEVEQWKDKCPIARFEKYLVCQGLIDTSQIEQVAAECEQEILHGRESFRIKAKANPREVFDFVYEQMTPELVEQQAEYFKMLDKTRVRG